MEEAGFSDTAPDVPGGLSADEVDVPGCGGKSVLLEEPDELDVSGLSPCTASAGSVPDEFSEEADDDKETAASGILSD